MHNVYVFVKFQWWKQTCLLLFIWWPAQCFLEAVSDNLVIFFYVWKKTDQWTNNNNNVNINNDIHSISEYICDPAWTSQSSSLPKYQTVTKLSSEITKYETPNQWCATKHDDQWPFPSPSSPPNQIPNTSIAKVILLCIQSSGVKSFNSVPITYVALPQSLLKTICH